MRRPFLFFTSRSRLGCSDLSDSSVPFCVEPARDGEAFPGRRLSDGIHTRRPLPSPCPHSSLRVLKLERPSCHIAASSQYRRPPFHPSLRSRLSFCLSFFPSLLLPPPPAVHFSRPGHVARLTSLSPRLRLRCLCSSLSPPFVPSIR